MYDTCYDPPKRKYDACYLLYLLLLQGCDASVLLTGNNSEQGMGPNLTLRPVALNLIESIRAAVHRACGRTVSCADLTVLATRDSLVLVRYVP